MKKKSVTPHEKFIEVGEKLRAIRKAKRYSLDEACARIGISRIFLSEIERALKVPSALVIRDIAAAYDIDEADLAAAYDKTPLSVEDVLRNDKDFMKVIYDIKNNDKLSEESKDEFFAQVKELYKDVLRSNT